MSSLGHFTRLAACVAPIFLIGVSCLSQELEIRPDDTRLMNVTAESSPFHSVNESGYVAYLYHTEIGFHPQESGAYSVECLRDESWIHFSVLTEDGLLVAVGLSASDRRFLKRATFDAIGGDSYRIIVGGNDTGPFWISLIAGHGSALLVPHSRTRGILGETAYCGKIIPGESGVFERAHADYFEVPQTARNSWVLVRLENPARDLLVYFLDTHDRVLDLWDGYDFRGSVDYMTVPPDADLRTVVVAELEQGSVSGSSEYVLSLRSYSTDPRKRVVYHIQKIMTSPWFSIVFGLVSSLIFLLLPHRLGLGKSTLSLMITADVVAINASHEHDEAPRVVVGEHEVEFASTLEGRISFGGSRRAVSEDAADPLRVELRGIQRVIQVFSGPNTKGNWVVKRSDSSDTEIRISFEHLNDGDILEFSALCQQEGLKEIRAELCGKVTGCRIRNPADTALRLERWITRAIDAFFLVIVTPIVVFDLGIGLRFMPPWWGDMIFRLYLTYLGIFVGAMIWDRSARRAVIRSLSHVVRDSPIAILRDSLDRRRLRGGD